MRAAAILAVGLILAACGSSPPASSGAVAPSASGTPSQVASAPRITPPAVTPPTPPGTSLPAFACTDASGGTAGVANETDVRVGAQSTYDRFVLQFDSTVPAYTVTRQNNPVFKQPASGQSITLSGTAGALVQVHTATGANTYTGPTDFVHPEFLVLNEAKLTGDFEGYVSWGLGLSRPACLRTFTLSNPPRLVVDFTSAPS
jgi:hypothetical protein